MSRRMAQLCNSQDRSYAAITIHPRHTQDSWKSRLAVVRALWGSKVTGPGLRSWMQRRSLSSPYHGPFQDKDREYVPSISILLDAGTQNISTDISTGQPSSRHVGKIASYLRYLSQEPRKLIQWSTHFDSTQATGFFEGYRWQDLPDNPAKRSKGSNTAEKDFIELQSLVERSRTTQETS